MHDENKLDLIVNDIFTERWAIGKSMVFTFFCILFLSFSKYLYFANTLGQYCQLSLFKVYFIIFPICKLSYDRYWVEVGFVFCKDNTVNIYFHMQYKPF